MFLFIKKIRCPELLNLYTYNPIQPDNKCMAPGKQKLGHCCPKPTMEQSAGGACSASTAAGPVPVPTFFVPCLQGPKVWVGPRGTPACLEQPLSTESMRGLCFH